MEKYFIPVILGLFYFLMFIMLYSECDRAIMRLKNEREYYGFVRVTFGEIIMFIVFSPMLLALNLVNFVLGYEVKIYTKKEK